MEQYDLVDLNQVRAYLHLADTDISEDAIRLYAKSPAATAATVEVQYSDAYAYQLQLIITGGANEGTHNIDLDAAGSDTTAGLAATINNLDGWVADLVGSGKYPSSDLRLLEQTSCLKETEAVTLAVVGDYFLEMLINHATTLIENELGYKIKKRTHREYYSGQGTSHLWLENIPIVNINMLSEGRDDAMTVTYDNGDAAYATVEVTDSSVRLRKKVSGNTTVNELAFSDYTTIGSLDTAIDELSGWTATVVSSFDDYPTSDLIVSPAKSANDADVTLEVPSACETDYEIEDADIGRIYNPYGFTRGHKNWFIEYVAGYDTVPAPIESACLELVGMMYNLSTRDTSLKSERIGDYSFTMADRLDTIFSATGDVKTANLISLKLAPYRRSLVFGG